MKILLNDPKTDDFYIPVHTLIRAHKLIRGGKPRQVVARMIINAMNAEASKNPQLRDRHPILREDFKSQLSIVDWRLQIADPECEDHEDYTLLLNRIRSRRHEENRRANLTPAEIMARRKRYRDYQRKRRKDPIQRELNRQRAREDYRKRRDENPMDHEVYLYNKRMKRLEDKKDPVKLERFREHAIISREKRKERYYSDPEFREQERAKNRERYYRRRIAEGKRRRRMTPTKVFILTPRGNYCIGTFTGTSHDYIVETMRMVAQNRGHAIEIQWPHTTVPTYISSKPHNVRRLQTKLDNLQNALNREQTCLAGATKRRSRKQLKKQISQLKTEIRRVVRLLRKAGIEPPSEE